jgi:hypothetical protein
MEKALTRQPRGSRDLTFPNTYTSDLVTLLNLGFVRSLLVCDSCSLELLLYLRRFVEHCFADRSSEKARIESR